MDCYSFHILFVQLVISWKKIAILLNRVVTIHHIEWQNGHFWNATTAFQYPESIRNNLRLIQNDSVIRIVDGVASRNRTHNGNYLAASTPTRRSNLLWTKFSPFRGISRIEYTFIVMLLCFAVVCVLEEAKYNTYARIRSPLCHANWSVSRAHHVHAAMYCMVSAVV